MYKYHPVAGVNGENVEKNITIDLSTLDNIPTEIEMFVDGKGARELQATVITPVDGKISIRLLPYGGFTRKQEVANLIASSLMR